MNSTPGLGQVTLPLHLWSGAGGLLAVMTGKDKGIVCLKQYCATQPLLWWQIPPQTVTAGTMPCYLDWFQQLKAKLEAKRLSLVMGGAS